MPAYIIGSGKIGNSFYVLNIGLHFGTISLSV